MELTFVKTDLHTRLGDFCGQILFSKLRQQCVADFHFIVATNKNVSQSTAADEGAVGLRAENPHRP